MASLSGKVAKRFTTSEHPLIIPTTDQMGLQTTLLTCVLSGQAVTDQPGQMRKQLFNLRSELSDRIE